MADNALKTSGASELSCEECSKDIPYAPESKDYVAYFCGLSCYTEWEEKHGVHEMGDDFKKYYVYEGEV